MWREHTPAVLVRSVIDEWNPVACHLVEQSTNIGFLRVKMRTYASYVFDEVSVERKRSHLFNGLLVVDRVNYADNIGLWGQVPILIHHYSYRHFNDRWVIIRRNQPLIFLGTAARPTVRPLKWRQRNSSAQCVIFFETLRSIIVTLALMSSG